MKRKLGGLIAVTVALVFMASVLYSATNWTATNYGKKDTKAHHVLVIIPANNHSNTDYSDRQIILKGTAADTCQFDISDYVEFNSIFEITEHDADTGNAKCEFQVSVDSDQWIEVDTVTTCRAADSTVFYKDWSVPKGFIYGRIIFTGRQNAVDSTSMHSIRHTMQQ